MSEKKLDEIKKAYKELSKKYKLPKFQDINQIFVIERVDSETDVLAKAIRALIMEKVFNFHAYLEMLINPTAAPRMYHPYQETMSEEHRKMIGKIYGDFSNLIIKSLERDTEYSEKKEAELIREAYESWVSVVPDVKKILEGIRKPIEKKKKEKSYFG